MNTFQIQELVSHGYVVAAIDQPYAAAAVVFPDGRQAPYDLRMDQRVFMDQRIPCLARDAVFACCIGSPESGTAASPMPAIRVGTQAAATSSGLSREEGDRHDGNGYR